MTRNNEVHLFVPIIPKWLLSGTDIMVVVVVMMMMTILMILMMMMTMMMQGHGDTLRRSYMNCIDTLMQVCIKFTILIFSFRIFSCETEKARLTVPEAGI